MTICDPCHQLITGWTHHPYHWRRHSADIRTRRNPHMGDLAWTEWRDLVTRQIHGIRDTCLRTHQEAAT